MDVLNQSIYPFILMPVGLEEGSPVATRLAVVPLATCDVFGGCWDGGGMTSLGRITIF
jgi:hypothetical protein